MVGVGVERKSNLPDCNSFHPFDCVMGIGDGNGDVFDLEDGDWQRREGK